jgi:prephenate dehydrogenase
MKKTIAIIGFGTFGQFITPFFDSNRFEVFAWNRTDKSAEAKQLGVNWTTLQEALQKEIIILATNISYFEAFLMTYGKTIQPNALVIDVASVKMKPVALMQKYLPATCEIIGTHPLFGPQSGKNGIEGLNCVLCPVRTTKNEAVFDFLSKDLKLNVIIKTPEEHDKEMAYVQGLTHFVARALLNLHLNEVSMKTKAFEHLLTIQSMLGGDSMELFKSIQNDNPFAEQVRKDFLQNLSHLDDFLKT